MTGVPRTIARSGLARADAVRAGYPVLLGARVPLYALSNVARSGATRSNYTSPATFITIDGIHYGTARAGSPGVLAESLTIQDQLNETPNTATMTVVGFVPTDGQEVIVTVGSQHNARREFAGHILSSHLSYRETPRNYQVALNLIDYQWGLDVKKVRARYTATTVQVIASSLMAAYAPATYTLVVQADIGAAKIDEITFTEQDLTASLTQLVKRVGGAWYCDYQRAVRLFFTDTTVTPPTLINAVHPTLMTLEKTRDLSQTISRMYVEGGGSNAAGDVPVGETILPVTAGEWYEAAGGVVVSGPQRITYASVVLGGGGGLVGPGAAPSAAPGVGLASGVGVPTGTHNYAVSYRTASGESVPGPVAPILVGSMAAPTAAPEPGSPSVGLGPDLGTHDYAVTFVTATGETTPGPRAPYTTATLDGPTAAPIPGTPTAGAGPEPGTHDYAVSFVTPSGETVPGPSGTVQTSAQTIAPSAAPTGRAQLGTELDVGTYDYVATFVTASGETTPSPISAGVVAHVDAPPTVPPTVTPIGGPPWQGATHTFQVLYYFSLYANAGDTGLAPGYTGPSPGAAFTAVNGGAGVWEVSANFTGSPYYKTAYVDYSSDNGITWVTMGSMDLPPGATSFSVGGSVQVITGGQKQQANNQFQRMTLANIPTGPGAVTARRVYRRTANTGHRLLVTLGDNTTTTFTDMVPTTSLGGPPPTTNTAGITAPICVVPIRSIPIGASGVTGRRLYRSVANTKQPLHLLATLGDNTTTTFTDTVPDASLGAVPPAAGTAALQQVKLSKIPTGSALVTARNVYRSAAGAAGSLPLQLVATLGDNTTTTFTDTVPDASLGAVAPTTGTAYGNQVQVSSIPIGPSAVTSRVLYRTQAGLTALKKLADLLDNVTTSYLDAISDGALGAAPPVSDTSGLAQPSNEQVLPGATSLPVANIGAFESHGGWAIIGNGDQVVRYTGKTATLLTGIPASGPGAIVAAITWNSTVTASAQLIGIPASGAGSIQVAVIRGDEVNLFVQVDDLDARAALAAFLGTDGIIEDYMQDRRLSHQEAFARGAAQLATKNQVRIEIRYRTRDLNVRTGRLQRVYLPGQPWALNDSFLIQSVTEQPHAYRSMPTFDAVASNARFTFDEFLRLIHDEVT